jgi:hypothetical protein
MARLRLQGGLKTSSLALSTVFAGLGSGEVQLHPVNAAPSGTLGGRLTVPVGLALRTDAAGAVIYWTQDNGTTWTAVQNGNQSSVQYSTIAETADFNNDVETSFGEDYEVPADTLAQGDVLRWTFGGKVTSVGGTDTLTIRIKVDNINVLILEGVPAENDTFGGQLTLSYQNGGAAMTGYAFRPGEDMPVMAYKAAFAMVETDPHTLDITLQWSSSAGNGCVLLQNVIEIL